MSPATRILLALVAGLLFGIASVGLGPVFVERATAVAEPIGGMWLNALRMTIVPLVVSLLITGVAATAEAARAGRLATRGLILFVVILWISSLAAALLTPLFLELFPLPADSIAALRQAMTGTEPVGQVPGFADFLRSIVPTNAIAAAAG